MAADQSFKLSQEQKDFFLTYGYIKVSGCFSREKAAEWSKDAWVRLGYSPTDKSTWKQERVHLQPHRQVSVQTFAPKAWSAICELLGGEQRIREETAIWNDGLILNLGAGGQDDSWPDPRGLRHWHVDGADFIHYLDSPEIGLLVLPLFSDVEEHAGGTMVCPDALPHIAQHLYNHPEGVAGGMGPRDGSHKANHPEGATFYGPIVEGCSQFHEMTGAVGDVLLLHPFSCHSQSKNLKRIPRIIVNAFVSLKDPFNFNRQDPSQNSLVEQKTLKSLEADRLSGWSITEEREYVLTGREDDAKRMKELESRRLQQANQVTAVA